MARMSPDERRQAIVDAALAVALRKGLAATTVRDVAAEMGTSSGLIHHYSSRWTMSSRLPSKRRPRRPCRDHGGDGVVDRPIDKLVAYLVSYTRADQDWAFQILAGRLGRGNTGGRCAEGVGKSQCAWQHCWSRPSSSGIERES